MMGQAGPNSTYYSGYGHLCLNRKQMPNMVTFNSWQIWNNYLDSKAWFYWIYQKIAIYGPTLSEAVSVHCAVKFNELVYLIGAIDCPKLFETLSQICAGKY